MELVYITEYLYGLVLAVKLVSVARFFSFVLVL